MCYSFVFVNTSVKQLRSCFKKSDNIRFNSHSPFFVGICIAIICLFYGIGIGNIQLFDWDEINFAQISREMILRNNYWQPTINFFPFHEKPPLFNWIQVISFQLFGINEMAARAPNILAAIFSLGSIYLIGKYWHNQRFGSWWMLFMAFSLLPQLYFRSGIIDPWFNLFIFLGLATLLVKNKTSPNWSRILAGGTLLGLGVLTKGPVAVLIAGLTLFFFSLTSIRSNLLQLWWKYLAVGIIALLPIMLWVAYVWTLDDGFFAREFIAYQWRLFSQPDAGHGGFPGYHVVVLLVGCFPASIMALPRLFKSTASPPEQIIKTLFWVVLVLFSIVSTKIIHYSSLAYFPITYLAAVQLEKLVHGGVLSSKYHLIGQFIWGLFTAVLLSVPFFIHLLLPQISFHDLGYRSSKVFSWESAYYLPLLSVPAIGLWFCIHKTFLHKNYTRYIYLQLLSTTYFTIVGLLFYIGPVQTLTQGSYVSFFQEKSPLHPYFGTAYHKSYAPLFYGKIDQKNGGRLRQFRFHGPTERNLYFSSPTHRKEQVLQEVPDAKWLYDEGGYSFYKRPRGITND